jgi:predicted PurR-regulated permease PerM
MDANLTRRIVLLALAAVLVWALFKVLEPFWNALAWSVCLAFLLGPIQTKLTARMRGRPSAAAAVITVLTPVVVLAPLTLLALLFVDQVTSLAQRLRASSLKLDSTLLVQLEQFPLIGPAIRWVRAAIPVDPAKLQEWVMNGAESALGNLASLGGGLLAGAVGTVVGFFLMLFLLFFMLRDGPAMLQRLTLLVPLEGERRTALLKLVGNTTRAVVYGTVLTSLLQGALVGVGFAIAGIPSPVVFGVLAALLALLPAGGSAIVWVPGVLWLLAIQQYGWAIFMTIWGAERCAARSRYRAHRPRAGACRRRQRQDARAHASRRVGVAGRRRLAAQHPRRHVHQQGRRPKCAHRIEQLLGVPGGALWVGTFHGIAHRLLRLHHAKPACRRGSRSSTARTSCASSRR